MLPPTAIMVYWDGSSLDNPSHTFVYATCVSTASTTSSGSCASTGTDSDSQVPLVQRDLGATVDRMVKHTRAGLMCSIITVRSSLG
jgi:hypothetical protein